MEGGIKFNCSDDYQLVLVLKYLYDRGNTKYPEPLTVLQHRWLLSSNCFNCRESFKHLIHSKLIHMHIIFADVC